MLERDAGPAVDLRDQGERAARGGHHQRGFLKSAFEVVAVEAFHDAGAELHVIIWDEALEFDAFHWGLRHGEAPVVGEVGEPVAHVALEFLGRELQFAAFAEHVIGMRADVGPAELDLVGQSVRQCGQILLAVFHQYLLLVDDPVSM